MLLDGVNRFGAGSWKKILLSYNFHIKRTAVDLKDKYRNILRAQERERSQTGYRKSKIESKSARVPIPLHLVSSASSISSSSTCAGVRATLW